MMEMNFCRRCGSPLSHVSESIYRCGNDHNIYLNPVPAANLFLLTESNQVLLAVRGIEPYKGMFDSFGGFVDSGETVEQALVREILEETGLSSKYYESPAYLCSSIMEYPFGGETRKPLSLYFWSRVHADAKLIASDDVASIKEIPLHTDDKQILDQIKSIEPFMRLREIINP